MALWSVSILPEADESLVLDIDRVDRSERIRSLAVEEAGGPEVRRISLVVDASDEADACSAACGAASRALGADVAFACIAERAV